MKRLLFAMMILLLLPIVAAVNDTFTGLIAYYNFSGNYLNYTPGHSFVVGGDPTFTTGIIGQGVALDGTDYFGTTNQTNTATGTVIFWLKMNSISVSATVYHQNNPNLWYCQFLGTSPTGLFCGFVTTDYTFPAVSTGGWTQYVIAQSGAGTYLWINGSYQTSVHNPVQIIMGSDGRWGCDLGAGTCLDADIDEICIFNRLLSNDEIAYYFNNGTGHECVAPVAPPPSVDVQIILKNLSKSVYPSVSETDIFNVYVNYSVGGQSRDPLACNFSAVNITYSSKTQNTSNFTIDSTNKFTKIVSENNVSIQNDSIQFGVCSSGTVTQDVGIYINGSLFHTVSADVIPLCRNGFHYENNVTDQLKTNRSMNISLQCPTCTVPSKQMRIVSINGTIFTFERQFDVHNETLTYNATSSLNEYYDPYRFTTAGQNVSRISVLCNGTAYSVWYNASNVNLTINILSIGAVAYTPGMQTESVENTTIIIDVFGDFVDLIQFNVSYNNGTLIKTTALEAMSLTNLNLNKDGIYNISIYAVDDNNDITIKKGYFLVNDTDYPVITWTNPLNDNSSTFEDGSSTLFKSTLTDLNLFAYEYTIKDSIDNIIKNISETGLTVDTKIIQTSVLFNVTGQWTVNLTVTDDHTAALIPDYDYDKIASRDLKFKLKDGLNNVTIDYISPYAVMDVDVKKETDRYTFSYDFNYLEDSNLKEITHNYRVTGQDLYYRSPVSGLKAHFVDYSAKIWLDFENEDIISYDVKPCGKNCYDVALTMPPAANIQFNSLGGLNEINEVVTFTVVPAGTANASLVMLECPTSLEGVMMLWLYVVLAVALFVIGCIFLPLLAPFSGIGLFLISFTLAGCSTFAGTTFIILSVLMFIGGVWRVIEAVIGN